MDLALAVFNIGAGLGVLVAGLSLAYLAWRMTPVIRESRALAADLRRLTATTDTELRPILSHARELTSNVEVLSEDVAVKLDRLSDLMNALQRSLDTVQITAAPQREEPRPEEPEELWPVDRDEPWPVAPQEPWQTDRQVAWPAELQEAWQGRQDPRPVEREEPGPVESWETREDPSDS